MLKQDFLPTVDVILKVFYYAFELPSLARALNTHKQ